MCESLLFQGHLSAALAGFNKNTRIVGDIVADIGRSDARLLSNILDAGSPFADGFLDLVQITSGPAAAFLLCRATWLLLRSLLLLRSFLLLGGLRGGTSLGDQVGQFQEPILKTPAKFPCNRTACFFYFAHTINSIWGKEAIYYNKLEKLSN